MPLYENKDFIVERDVRNITLKVKSDDRCFISAAIDPHDNRIMINSIKLGGLPQDQQLHAIGFFCEILEKHFGGKEFVCLHGEQKDLYQTMFRVAGFSDAIKDEKELDTHMDRVRITTVSALVGTVKLNLPPGFVCETPKLEPVPFKKSTTKTGVLYRK